MTTPRVIKRFRRIIKSTLPYHTTDIGVDDLIRVCDTVDRLQARIEAYQMAEKIGLLKEPTEP